MTAVGSGPRFRLLPPERPADDLEQEMLARWTEEDLFGRTQEARAGAPPFVFFEGPPTANGLPGIHHVFSRTIKDLVLRHRVMSGHHVTRKGGWDTHGLPVEIEVEKQLGISGKPQIEAIGVERFNQLCRESVWKYKGDWQRLSERIGYWLDFDDAYVTYTNDYIESVWWALRTLFDRGLLYQGYKILPYCARCGTALSSHEVAQGWEEATDPSLFVALDLTEAGEGPVERDAAGRSMRRILVWTTTPWTLVSNTALAVHPELEYAELRRRDADDRRTVLLAEARVTQVLGDDWADRWAEVRRLRGRDLAGWRYQRPLDWVEYGSGEHELIVAAEFVSASDGTGVVHMSPAFGADDYAAGQRHGLAFVQPVDGRGRFPESMPIVGGRFVKEADADIIQELKRRGLLWKAGTLVHQYPHCWRCRTPLLYYARTSWFVRTTAFKDEMLARNARVEWHPPELGTGRFDEWLENNVDWAISRDRYWGTPLPIWVNDEDPAEVEAIGSYAELAERIGRPLPEAFDPHKPFIDEYTWPARSGSGTMRRVPEVIDAWFDSGSMPFAQWHFPFEHHDLFERHYPADFIAEGVDQTRGWFYSMLAIATGLGEALPKNDARVTAAPYGAVIVNDMVLDANGVKMSKSRGNVVDPWTVLQRHGADAVRLFLVHSSQVWVSRRFDEQQVREIVGRLVTLKNVYSGIFALYANFGWAPSAADPRPAERPAVDRWMLARLAVVERGVDADLREMDATSGARRILDFVDADVSKWYVRLNRHRFYEVDGDDNRAAFATLHDVLVVTCRLLAPYAPFLTDWMHRELTGESVHLAPFVRAEADAAVVVDPELLDGMDAIRRLAGIGRAAREERSLKVRQPLARMVCVVPNRTEGSLEPLLPLLMAELNVKRVDFVGSSETLVSLGAKPNFRALGAKWGKRTKQAAAAVSELSSDALLAFERGERVAITVEGETRPLEAEDLQLLRSAAGDLVVRESDGFVAAIDPVVTPELRQEGLARELVSRIQRLRKDAGLAVSDRIRLVVTGNDQMEAAVEAFRDRIASDVLAVEIRIGARDDVNTGMHAVELDGLAVRIAITKVG